jgi:Fe-S cluster assembly protein SufB
LTKQGIIFCPISEAIQNHPELVKKYLGSVIPTSDHFFATLNSAVFTDGSFVYIPEGVRCPMNYQLTLELMHQTLVNSKEL